MTRKKAWLGRRAVERERQEQADAAFRGSPAHIRFLEALMQRLHPSDVDYQRAQGELIRLQGHSSAKRQIDKT